MPLLNVESWEKFDSELVRLRGKYPQRPESGFLFRGLPDSDFKATTTLDRAGKEGMRVSMYYERIHRMKHQIESFTGQTWALPTFPEVDAELRADKGGFFHSFDEKIFSYLVYLRHYGFPSPLMDWSRSPYVASYFAFRSHVQPASGKVTICVLSEMPMGTKEVKGGSSQLCRIGSYLSAHKRHFFQQSDYTMCLVHKKAWHFALHEDLFNRTRMDQDVMWKFDIPWTERSKVLRHLDSYNLNAFSLFGSEESLMETLANQVL